LIGYTEIALQLFEGIYEECYFMSMRSYLNRLCGHKKNNQAPMESRVAEPRERAWFTVRTDEFTGLIHCKYNQSVDRDAMMQERHVFSIKLPKFLHYTMTSSYGNMFAMGAAESLKLSLHSKSFGKSTDPAYYISGNKRGEMPLIDSNILDLDPLSRNVRLEKSNYYNIEESSKAIHDTVHSNLEHNSHENIRFRFDGFIFDLNQKKYVEFLSACFEEFPEDTQ